MQVELIPKTGLLLLVMLFASPLQAADVHIAVAANFFAPLKELTSNYEKESGDRLIISAGSSGKLFAQIVNGAPYDLFLSADQNFPKKLIQRGAAVAGSEFIYATGVLALWGREKLPIEPKQLRAARTRRIAMANPATAPYGAAAQDTMKKLAMFDELKKKIVQGESVGQAFQFVASGNAQLGFIALSQVLSSNNRFNRDYYWQVPANYHAPLKQAAVLLNKGQDNKAAKAFMSFLQRSDTQQQLKRLGYR